MQERMPAEKKAGLLLRKGRRKGQYRGNGNEQENLRSVIEAALYLWGDLAASPE